MDTYWACLVCFVTKNALSVVLGEVGRAGFLRHARFATVGRVQQPLVLDRTVDQGRARLRLAHYCLLSGTLKISYENLSLKNQFGQLSGNLTSTHLQSVHKLTA
jgi:hypothetical protein